MTRALTSTIVSESVRRTGEMRIGFVPSATLEGLSARMRCFWVAKYWPEAMILDGLSHTGDTEIVVFQKSFSAHIFEQVQYLKAHERKIVWDLHDPNWWLYPKEHAQMAQVVDAVVCSTRALADDFATEFPDHSPLDHHRLPGPGISSHDQNTCAHGVSLLWFGDEK